MIGVNKVLIMRNGEVIFNYHGVYMADTDEKTTCTHMHRSVHAAMVCAQKLANKYHEDMEYAQ